MRGFADAGGWVGEALWEFAPSGRPHLYPPFFHLVEFFMFRLGVQPIAIARILDFFIFPLFLFLIWRLLRRTCSDRLAFLAVLLMAASHSFYLSVTNNIPFTLALLFGCYAFYFLRSSKILSAILSLALSFYTHALASWIMFAALFVYGLFSPRERRRCFVTCLMSLLLASPFLWHQARYLAFFHPRRVLEFYYAHFNPLLYLLAFAGFLQGRRRGGAHLFFAALLLGMAVLWWTHRDRLISGPGLLPVSVLAAFFLDYLWAGWRLADRRIFCIFFWGGIALLFYFAQPLLVFSPFRPTAAFTFDSVFAARGDAGGASPTGKEASLYSRKFIEEAVVLIAHHSAQGEAIFSNYPYVGGLLAVLAHRPATFAMLGEVAPFLPQDPVRSARLVLWLKDESGNMPQDLVLLSRLFDLKRLGETDLFYLFENKAAFFPIRMPRARVPEVICWLMLAGVCLMFIFEPSAAEAG